MIAPEFGRLSLKVRKNKLLRSETGNSPSHRTAPCAHRQQHSLISPTTAPPPPPPSAVPLGALRESRRGRAESGLPLRGRPGDAHVRPVAGRREGAAAPRAQLLAPLGSALPRACVLATGFGFAKKGHTSYRTPPSSLLPATRQLGEVVGANIAGVEELLKKHGAKEARRRPLPCLL